MGNGDGIPLSDPRYKFKWREFFTSQTMEASGLRRSNDVGSRAASPHPMGKAIWLLSSHSPSFAWRARFNLHYGESVAHFPCSSITARSVAVSVQIGIIPSLPPARLCRVHSTFASDDRNRSPIGRAPIHSLVLPSLSLGTRTDGRKEGRTGRGVYNK